MWVSIVRLFCLLFLLVVGVILVGLHNEYGPIIWHWTMFPMLAVLCGPPAYILIRPNKKSSKPE